MRGPAREGVATAVAVRQAPAPVDVECADCGARFQLSWNETNRRFPIQLSVETIDGTELGWGMEGELEAGREAGARLGGDVVVVFAGPVQFEAEEPVDFVVRMNFAGDTRSVPVRLMDNPARQ